LSDNVVAAPTRILIVEDSDSVRVLVADYLQQRGYDVMGVTSLLAARAALKTFQPEVVVLDLGLDDGDGSELLSDMRHSGIGCIVISSRADIRDRLQLLELGADDYLIKPFDLQELYLRVRNMLAQRLRGGSASGDVVVEYHGIRILLATRSVIDAEGKPIATLTDSELLLIRALSQAFGNVVTRKDLYGVVFGRKSFEGSRALDVLVSKLRRKLKDIGSQLDIKSVRGSGYMMMDDTTGF
jgi:two-component system response regulator MprA